MKTKNLLVVLLTVVLCGCATEEDGLTGVYEKTIKGHVQKGPFINGTLVVISDLDDNLEQTGISYTTSVLDNSGKFEHANFQLTSNVVELTATGYYFNEVTNKISSSTLTLKALADVSGTDSVNVNLLTHLQRARIDYLVKQGGVSFDSAKAQSYREVMGVFAFDAADAATSEDLDITMGGEENAKLLAASILLQGYRTTGEMAELLANIVLDIRIDGILNDSTLGSRMLDDARLISLAEVRANLENRYSSLNLNCVVPDFEQYVNHFINHSGYTPITRITYPDSTQYGTNLLCDTVTRIQTMKEYPLSAFIPTGMDLKIVLRGGAWYYRSMNNEGIVNCSISQYDSVNKQQTFTSTASDATFSMLLQDFTPGTLYIDFYENKATVPTKTKTITVINTDPNNPGNEPNDSSQLIRRRY